MFINIFYKLYYLFAKIFYRLKVEGAENIPKEGPIILVFNHIAPIIDGLTGGVGMQARPDGATFGGAALPRGGFFGKMMTRRGAGIGSIKMLSAVKAQGLSGIELLKALKMLQNGKAISLAAEGEISWDGKLQYPLAPGAAWMALRGHAPVVAIVSSGGYDIMPRWASFPKLTGKVTIRVSKPFYVHDGPITRLTEELITSASDRIYNEMSSLVVN